METKYLFEVWEKQPAPEKDRFIGNGLVVVFPDGERKLVTAAHVAYSGPDRRDVTIKGDPELLAELPDEISFTKRDKRLTDVAEMPLSPGEGIPVATSLPSQELNVIGYPGRYRNPVPVTPTRLGTKAIQEGDNELSSPTLHLEEKDSGQTCYPGWSGSGVFTNQDKVVAILTAGYPGKGRLIADILHTPETEKQEGL